METLEDNLNKLDYFSGLKENWDREMGLPFSNEHIEKVKDIIIKLPTQPKIFPTGRGSIQLEYEEEDLYLEFEIYEDKTSILLMEGNDAVFEKIVTNREKEKIYNLVRRISNINNGT
jgi:hypothetical protein